MWENTSMLCLSSVIYHVSLLLWCCHKRNLSRFKMWWFYRIYNTTLFPVHSRTFIINIHAWNITISEGTVAWPLLYHINWPLIKRRVLSVLWRVTTHKKVIFEKILYYFVIFLNNALCGWCSNNSIKSTMINTQLIRPAAKVLDLTWILSNVSWKPFTSTWARNYQNNRFVCKYNMNAEPRLYDQNLHLVVRLPPLSSRGWSNLREESLRFLNPFCGWVDSIPSHFFTNEIWHVCVRRVGWNKDEVGYTTRVLLFQYIC